MKAEKFQCSNDYEHFLLVPRLENEIIIWNNNKGL